MKKRLVYLLIAGGFIITACSKDKDKNMQEQVIGEDTVGVEYKVEKKVIEKSTDVDTVVKDSTIEKKQ